MRRLLVIGLLTLSACGSPQTPSTSSSSATAPAQVDRQPEIADLPAPYNEANYEAGRRAFAQCRSCHVIQAGAPNRVGPNLHGVFGRHTGTAPGFTYSQALQNADFIWDADHLDHWLQNPQTFLPGTRMAFPGVHDDTQRRDLIAYLMIESKPDE
ncbi:MAG: cytochrome c family protein [Hyphomonadaceae bacterium]